MTTAPTEVRGRLHHMADAFQDALEAGDQAAAQDLLAAWSEAYWATRTDLDELVAYVAGLRAEGKPVSPSALGRERRFRAVLETAMAEMRRYGAQAAGIIQANQEAAQAAALTQAQALVAQAVATGLPGIALDLAHINPGNLQTAIGFMGNGTPLARHMARTVAPEAVAALRKALLHGLSRGWDQRRMVKAFTEGLAVGHTRATTILRTESLRVYRETSRAVYEANTHVVESWQWQCALDRRSCVACVLQHGTRHPVTETLDGHPRCRCAMVPLTRTWESLGITGVEDTRSVLGSGEDWLLAQSARTQRAMMGPWKFDAWRAGVIRLDQMVARTYDPDWGTMRLERSLKAIIEGRNENWGNIPVNSS